MFEQMMMQLAEDYWLIAPDLPGFGNSFVPAQPLSVELWATAVFHTLAALNVTTCPIFGHHTGASVAVQMAYERPSLIPKLILSGPPLLDETMKQRLRGGLPQHTLAESGDFLLKEWWRLRHKEATVPLALTLREMILSLELNGRYHQAYEAVFNHDFAGQLATLTCPILLMAGEQDSLRHSLEPAQALAKNSTIQLIANAGTYICDQQPKVVADLIRGF
jgi:pimeloyl-ACP methyl ester carboxylesterase